MTEANRDEAERCVELAIGEIRGGRIERAAKLLQKSLALYPSLRAQTLLNEISKNQEPAPAPTPAPPPPPSSSSPFASSTDSESEVRRVLAAGNDYYSVFNLPRSCDLSEIKRQYKILALKLHPDKAKSRGAEEAFKKLGAAYACLSNPTSRETYDRHGVDPAQPRASESGGSGGGGFSGMYRRRGFDFNEEEVDADEIFRAFFFGPDAVFAHSGQQRPRVYRRHFFHQHQQQQQAGGWAGLFQVFMIIAFFGLLSLLSSSINAPPEPAFSLVAKGEFVVERKSPVLGRSFFVKQGTPESDSLGEEVDRTWITYLSEDCRASKVHQPFNARNTETRSCAELRKALKQWQKS